MLLDYFHQVNTLPSYENVVAAYQELSLPIHNLKYLKHRKEQMIYMIINMVRTKPTLYLQALGIL